MAVTLDRMAQRYGKLPSEVLERATVLDFRIMDVADSYLNYQRTIAETGRPPPPKLSIDQMQAMMDKVKNK
jgi:hypothetical protein